MAYKPGAAKLCFAILAVAISTPAYTETSVSQLKPEYQKWLTEDVRWIISDQERQDFLHLTTDSDRLQFVANFWERRNPTPGSATNAFKEEHYRRLVFANEHFAANVPGWETDRGRIYIVYGPPDSIAKHFSALHRPEQEWHYSHLQGGNIGEDFKFEDTCSCGDYRLLNHPADREK